MSSAKVDFWRGWNTIMRGRDALANNTSTTKWSGSQPPMISDERGNFCGNSRLVRKLTHTIYGGYLQIAAPEQRVHATSYRINLAHRECPYSYIVLQHVGLLCAQEWAVHPIGRATMKPANRWKSLLWLSCFPGKDSHGNTKKVRFVLKQWCRGVKILEYVLRKGRRNCPRTHEVLLFSGMSTSVDKATHRTCEKLNVKYHENKLKLIMLYKLVALKRVSIPPVRLAWKFRRPNKCI